MEKESGMNELKIENRAVNNVRWFQPAYRFVLSSFFFFLFSAFYFCLSPVSAQEPNPLDVAPPPFGLVSKSERSQLDALAEAKKRTKLALELMDLRIKKSEELHARQDFDEMFKELGGFQALVDDMLRFLTRNDNDSRKILDNFKRFEIGIRGFRPRLEIIRRDLPSRYEVYVRNLIKYLRDARTRAVEPFFGDTVLPNRKT